MNRKKLIRKLGFIVGIIFFVSIVILILSVPYRTWQYKKHQGKLEIHLSALIEQYQIYLKETAQTITTLPIDQRIVHDLESKYLQEHQQVNKIKKYLWMSNSEGKFEFGVPAMAFARLNPAYDKYSDVITSDVTDHRVENPPFFLED